MFLAYIDESTTRAGDYYFAAVIATGAQSSDLTERLNRLMSQVWRDQRVPWRTELHAKDLFGGEGVWANVAPAYRAWVAERVIQETVESGVRFCARGVDGPRLLARQARENYPVNFSVEQEAFKHLLQRVDGYASAQGTHALVIADDRNDREARRQDLALHRVTGTPGDYWHTNFGAILDTLHFAPSHHSRMLQAADHVAFFYRRRQEINPERDPRAETVVARIAALLNAPTVAYQCGLWVP